jgi:SAM-dependent methyltransferase
MFTVEAIKYEISRSLGWEEVGRILGMKGAEQYLALAEEWQIRDVFSKLLFTSDEARKKLLRYQPPEGVVNVLSDADMRYAVGSGAKDAFLIDKLIEKHAPGAKDVLDFGCGSGRLLRFLAQFSPERRYCGCDVIEEAIEHLKQSGIPGEFMMIPSAPPTSFVDQSFDVIFAWSIFSHYSESLHLDWLQDLKRVLRPGGVLLATIHSPESIDTQRADPRVAERIDFDEIEKSYNSGDFAFSLLYKYYNMGGLDEDNFGQAFIPRSYINNHWSKNFGIIEIAPAVAGWQDMVVLRRPV